MKTIEECNKYIADFSKATKANSFVADGRIIMIMKKEYDGKSTKMYVAYDSSTKVQLVAHHDRDEVIKFLQKQDLSVLGVDNTRLF